MRSSEPSAVRQRRRRLAARALVAAACGVLLLALVAAYTRRAVVDSDQFANRATVALRDDSVRSLVAEKITDDVVLANQADLIAARPIIESVAGDIIGSRAFTGVFRAAVGDLHRALFDRDRDTVTLTVADAGTLLAAALEKLRPALAREVETTSRVALVRRDVGSLSADLARFADRIRLLAPLLSVLCLALAAGAVAVAPDRRRTVVELGVGAAAAGVVLLVALGVLRSVAIDRVEGPDGQAAAGAVWDAFLGDLWTSTWVLAGSGAVIAAAAASLIKPVALGEPLRRAARALATEPSRPALRALRGAGLVALGVIVLVERDAVLQLLLAAAGAYLIYEGLSAVLRLVYRPPAPRTEAARAPDRRRLAAPLIATALIAGTVAAFLANGGATTAAPAKGPCNGHGALCARSLARVALPATHNSMSVPLPGWFSAEQDRPIADQLRDGVRGLLLDTHYADRLPNGRVRTYFGSRDQLRRQAAQDGVSSDAVDAALRLRERLGFAGQGKRGIYVCHSFCELGATPLASVLDDLHDFLLAHPDEVLVVINQDYVTPEDFVAAARTAGLADLAYGGPIDAMRPTLREMIDADRRVVFLAEHHAGAAPWYRSAYERATDETPYAFSKLSQLISPGSLEHSCRPNRGRAGAPLFLLNHWITTDPVPLPSNAAKVNAYDVLLARARECRRLRKHLPNLVAVNFYRRGDLFRVVDELNGVR
ncbi:MAG TPA: hypothetical protein VGJ70_11595 [Solirubrobacteraceae bacterium]